jgi:hypothetical protein
MFCLAGIYPETVSVSMSGILLKCFNAWIRVMKAGGLTMKKENGIS